MPPAGDPCPQRLEMSRQPELILRLAGVTIALCSDSPHLLAAAQDAWGHHSDAVSATNDVFAVHYTVGPEFPDGRPPADTPAGGAYNIVVQPGGFEIRAAEFRARADLQRRVAEVTGPADLAPLHVLLRNLLPGVIHDGILLHGAALADCGRAWICTGPSGCGKSTLAALFPAAALSDELVAIRRVEGRFMVEGLPFRTSRADVATLAGVHLLRHGASNTRTPLPAAFAVRKLAGEVLWPTWSQPATAAALSLLADLTAAVPFFDLAFLPDGAVWPLLTGRNAAA